MNKILKPFALGACVVAVMCAADVPEAPFNLSFVREAVAGLILARAAHHGRDVRGRRRHLRERQCRRASERQCRRASERRGGQRQRRRRSGRSRRRSARSSRPCPRGVRRRNSTGSSTSAAVRLITGQ